MFLGISKEMKPHVELLADCEFYFANSVLTREAVEKRMSADMVVVTELWQNKKVANDEFYAYLGLFADILVILGKVKEN